MVIPNITISHVLKKAKFITKNDADEIKRAYNFAYKAHKGQKRNTGEDYIIHPLHVAYYLADIGFGKTTIISSLLHDVLEDCQVTEKTIEKEFGSGILKIVKGVTKLRHTSNQAYSDSTVENLRRFLIVASDDIRVLIIKLADRLHNAYTIKGLPLSRQKSYADEIKLVYSTLSEYLGIQYFKREFDDIAFRILQPEEYSKINNYLINHFRRRKKYINKVKEKIITLLRKQKIKAEVFGREKSLYSIYSKILKYIEQGKIHSESEIGRVYDIYGFRILVDNVEDCYRVLGIIHTNWHPLIGEFDDYIANPKPNGYKSIQTTVFCEDEKLAEIQIRTYKMHEYNEFGPASHIAYKMSHSSSHNRNAFLWIKFFRLFSPQKNKEESLKDFDLSAFKENIYVLTPKNEVKQIPKGGTPIDFAYSIHTEIGNKCRGAKVNGKMVPLEYELHTGDQIEIIIDKNAKYPKTKWLDYVISQATKARIKSALRKKEEKEAIERGYKKINYALKKYNTTFLKLYKEREHEINFFIYKNNAFDKEGFLARIGFGLISLEKFLNKLFPENIKKQIHPSKQNKVIIEGDNRTRYSFAKCCVPEKRDKIIAFVTVSRGIKIHKENCKWIQDRPKNRILRAEWE